MDVHSRSCVRRSAQALASHQERWCRRDRRGSRINSRHNLQEGLATVLGAHEVDKITLLSIASSLILYGSPTSKQNRHLRQGISITGLGLDDFQDQVNMIPDIAALFT